MADLFEKVKRTQEQAAAAAREAAAKAVELRDSTAGLTRDVRDSLAAAASDLRDAGEGKLRETLSDFTAALPVLGEMGYTLAELSITLGLPPSLHATFDVSREVTDDEVANVLARHAERRLTTFLVRSLVHARRLQSSVSIVGMKPRGIGVDLGLSPHVSITFSR